MNIGSLLTNTARLHPDQPGIIHGEKTITFSQFNDRASQLAKSLLSLGVRQGECIPLIQYNYPEMLESMFACFKAGIIAVPINFRLHPTEFAYIINHCKASTVIISPEFNQDILRIQPKTPNIKHVITLSGAQNDLFDYEDFLSKSTPEWQDIDVSPNETAWLFYTSGTTGKPKGAMLTHQNLLMMTLAFYADYGQLSPDDAILHAAPLSHGSGLYSLPNIAGASTNVILDSKSFDSAIVFESIEKYRITNMFAAPTMVKMMVDHPAITQHDLSSLRSVIYGGGPMHVDDLKAAITRLGSCLTQLYGMGESPMTISYLPNKDHVVNGAPEQMKRLASAGIPRMGVQIKIVDDNDQELPFGKIGQVITKSGVVMKGYWQNLDASTKTLKNSWLHTGDLGYIDTDGYLYLLDRSKDMIISGGENIYPRELEEVIIQHPHISEVAVIGIPDEKWGEAVMAIISPYPGQLIKSEEIILLCKGLLASYKKPKFIEFIDKLPKNNNGKILKRELRIKFQQ